MRLGIVIVTYNIDISVFFLQINAIRKYCKDDFDIEIVDNSSIPQCASSIRYHCDQLGLKYHKSNSIHGAGTESHAFAANFSYKNIFKDKYDYLFYIDHDCIPIKDFSIIKMLGEKIIGGLGQGDKTSYFWAGLVFWNNKEIDKNLVNFSPSHELGLDTGGMLYRAIDAYGKENCVFLGEEYWENQHIKDTDYNFYSILGETFMHFINSSNWNKQENNQERINSLINICNEWISKN